MPRPWLSRRRGPSDFQSALLLGRGSDNRLVTGGFVQLDLMVMISDILTSLSGIYMATNEMVIVSSLLRTPILLHLLNDQLE